MLYRTAKTRLPLSAFVPFILCCLFVLTLSRALLAWWQADLLPEGSLGFIFLTGLRFDIASLCALFALPLLIAVLFSLCGWVPRQLMLLLRAWCAAALAFLVMNEAATPGFMAEYGVRPNHIYVQYLIYPQEVIKTLWGGHKLELLCSLLLIAAAMALGWYVSGKCLNRGRQQKGNRITLVLQLIALLVLVPLGIRSSLGHRPLNPSVAAFCDSPLVNTLPLNSSYSAIYALTKLGSVKLDASTIYARVPVEQVLTAARSLSDVNALPARDGCPLLQQIEPAPSFVPVNGKMRNVVIVLEESLGADFVKSLGGLELTPQLERLKVKGWWFERMYAAGHRSIRGIEAVSAGFPPSPLDSIVKLLPRGDSYATLAQIYRGLGYHTSFIYGGESHFDNMRSYFLNNGMEDVIEQKDYQNPSFVASWGVSDEDLFAAAHQSFLRDHEAGQPFFSLVFTSSFHDPFEIPQGKVSLDFAAGEEEARYLAVKYADYALGSFMDQALASPYARDTVFLIIADHESKVRAQGVFPLDKFRIPALIIAPGLPAQSDSRIVSQIDMPPTLLALSGFKGAVPYVGQDLNRATAKERALVQFNQIFGLLDRSGFIALTPGQAAATFRLNAQGQLERAPRSAEDIERAATLENLGPLMYLQGYMSKNCISYE